MYVNTKAEQGCTDVSSSEDSLHTTFGITQISPATALQFAELKEVAAPSSVPSSACHGSALQDHVLLGHSDGNLHGEYPARLWR